MSAADRRRKERAEAEAKAKAEAEERKQRLARKRAADKEAREKRVAEELRIREAELKARQEKLRERKQHLLLEAERESSEQMKSAELDKLKRLAAAAEAQREQERKIIEQQKAELVKSREKRIAEQKAVAEAEEARLKAREEALKKQIEDKKTSLLDEKKAEVAKAHEEEMKKLREKAEAERLEMEREMASLRKEQTDRIKAEEERSRRALEEAAKEKEDAAAAEKEAQEAKAKEDAMNAELDRRIREKKEQEAAAKKQRKLEKQLMGLSDSESDDEPVPETPKAEEGDWLEMMAKANQAMKEKMAAEVDAKQNYVHFYIEVDVFKNDEWLEEESSIWMTKKYEDALAQCPGLERSKRKVVHESLSIFLEPNDAPEMVEIRDDGNKTAVQLPMAPDLYDKMIFRVFMLRDEEARQMAEYVRTKERLVEMQAAADLDGWNTGAQIEIPADSGMEFEDEDDGEGFISVFYYPGYRPKDGSLIDSIQDVRFHIGYDVIDPLVDLFEDVEGWQRLIVAGPEDAAGAAADDDSF